MSRIYLDNNASTFVDPLVADVIKHTLCQYPGNPSSPHSFGREARSVLLQARQTIATYLKVHPKEIIFTSGGTEGANLIMRGLVRVKGHLITSNVEHACVYSAANWLKEMGWEVTFLQAGTKGGVSPQQVEAALQPNTRLIALMAVNNETGVKTDLETMANLAEKKNIPFFVDGVALLGKESFTIPSGVSAMVFSGHKFHAPKGCGFAYVKSNLKLEPLLIGGEQEFNRRGGTENLADIAGMAEAIRILEKTLPESSKKMLDLRLYFENALKEHFDDMIINGEGERICNTVNIAFPDVDGETLLAALDLEGIAASHGSACASGAMEPSRILLNMGMSLKRVRESLRFSLSRFTTQEEIDHVIKVLVALVNNLKKNHSI